MKSCKTLIGAWIFGVCAARGVTLQEVIVRSPAYQNGSELQELLGDLMGEEIDGRLLQRVLDEISRYYRARGYNSAEAFYPEQTADDGRLVVEIAHPRMEEVRIGNEAGLNGYAMDLLFDGFHRYEQGYFSERELTGRLYRLGDLGMFGVDAAFERAGEANNVNLKLDLYKVRPVSFAVFADNHGTEASGRYRAGGQARFNNLTGSADSLSLFYARSSEAQNNFSLGYEIPVSARPAVAGASVCLSDYDLAGDYEILGAAGRALSFDLYLREPLVRERGAKLSFDLGARYRLLKDEFEAFDVEFKKHTWAGWLGLEGAGGTGRLAFSGRGRVTLGTLKNDDEWELYDEGGYALAAFDGTFSYSATAYLTLKNRLSMQLGSDNLESSERFIGGGARGVRAYDSNAVSGDSGILNSAMLQYRPVDGCDLAFAPHFDAAYVKSAAASGEKLFGAGLAVGYRLRGFFIDGSLDFPVGRNPTASGDDFKVFLSAGYNYV